MLLQLINYSISLMGQLSQIMNSLTEIWSIGEKVFIRKLILIYYGAYSIKIVMFVVIQQQMLFKLILDNSKTIFEWNHLDQERFPFVSIRW